MTNFFSATTDFFLSLFSPGNALAFLLLIVTGGIFRLLYSGELLLYAYLLGVPVSPLFTWKINQLIFGLFFTSYLLFRSTLTLTLPDGSTPAPFFFFVAKLLVGLVIWGLIFYGGMVANDLYKRFIEKGEGDL